MTAPHSVPDGTAETAKRQNFRQLHRMHLPRHLSLISIAEDIVHYAVAVLLLALALFVMARTVGDFVAAHHSFPERVTGVINGVLFVIIVMEILRTVVAHFGEADFQLKPFLIIGIISAVRHILTVGAQLSLGVEKSANDFRRAQVELGVNAGVVLALVTGLVFVRRTDQDSEAHAVVEH
jgi:uncharacterized membrane protein (DUF373 family)